MNATADDAYLSAEAGGRLDVAGVAGTPTVSEVKVAEDTISIRSRDLSSGAVRGNLGYLRFNLQSLVNPNIQYARLTLNRVSGDTAVTGRVALFGLDDLAENSPQDWVAPFAAGAEFDVSIYEDFVGNPGVSPVNLTQVWDFSEEEAVSGSVITLESEAFIDFLQERADDDGLVTILISFPSAGDGQDKTLTYASYAYSDTTLQPSLLVTYADADLPSPPSGLAATDIEYSLDPVVQLGWNAVENATSYRVFKRAEGETDATEIGIAGVTSYVDDEVELLETYYYSVSAIGAKGESIPSLEVAVTLIDLETAAPSIPDGIALIEGGLNSIEIDWDDSSDALQYEVFRSTKNDEGFELVDMPLDSESLDESGIVGYQTYYYLIDAIGPGGRSGFSVPFEVEPRFERGFKPSQPRKIDLVERTNFTVSLAWEESRGADGYAVYRSTSPLGGYERVETVGTNGFLDEFAVYPEQTYYYSIKAIGEGGYSLPSRLLKVEPTLTGFRQAEYLKRAPVAVSTDDGVYVSWRLLGTDLQSVAFNLYRDGRKLNRFPISDTTNYLDEGGYEGAVYEVRPVMGFVEVGAGETCEAWGQNYFALPLQAPQGGQTPDGVDYDYSANDASVADLDGDGEYEVILKWDPSNSKDNSQSGHTGNVYIDAYELDGTLLWRIDLGVNIRAGAHYTQFMVYDFDGDGKAELICKTGDGTTDNAGTVIGDANADYRNASGYILTGPEYLSVFDGLTGEVVDTVSYNPQRHPESGDNPTEDEMLEMWGDTYGNRIDRFLAGVGYFDGVRPSFFTCRGQYRGQGNRKGRTVIAAYDYVDGELVERWIFDTEELEWEWAGQGHHQLSVGDVDLDGRDEILYGGMVVDDDGTGLYTTELGHGDAMHFGDFDPTHPGREVFAVKEESAAAYHAEFHDASNGEIIWGVNNGRDTGRGLIADIDPFFPGGESWGAANLSVWDSEGGVIGYRRPSMNFAIWWDGDPMRELLDDISIRKWDYNSESEVVLLDATGTASNNGTKATPALQADLFGDWREEVMLRSEDSSELRIYTTTDMTDRRIVTLMHDPVYRLAVAWQNNGYNQPPHPSFFIGNNVPATPWPSLYVAPVPIVSGKEWSDGEYVGHVSVSLGVNLSSELVNEYRVNDGPWKRYLFPFQLHRAGDYKVEFRTLDASGNELIGNSTEFSIERRGKFH